MNVAITEVGPIGNLDRCVKCQFRRVAQPGLVLLCIFIIERNLRVGDIISIRWAVVSPSLDIEGPRIGAGKKGISLQIIRENGGFKNHFEDC